LRATGIARNSIFDRHHAKHGRLRMVGSTHRSLSRLRLRQDMTISQSRYDHSASPGTRAHGYRVAREVAVMVYYRDEPLARQSLDMVVDDRVVIEIKSTEHLHPSGTLQLFGYLCATNLEVGLLLHFGREAKFYRVVYENRLKDRKHE
jgi:GxxExxY protein